MALEQFLDEINRIQRLFKRPEFDMYNLTPADAEHIFRLLDYNMRPEYLFRDADRPLTEIERDANMYSLAFDELKGLGYAPRGPLQILS